MNVIVKAKKGEPVDNFGGKLCAVVVVGSNGAQCLLRGNGAESDYLSLINGLNAVMRDALGAFTEEK